MQSAHDIALGQRQVGLLGVKVETRGRQIRQLEPLPKESTIVGVHRRSRTNARESRVPLPSRLIVFNGSPPRFIIVVPLHGVFEPTVKIDVGW